jgi:parallel beta-helix repeat protein
MRPESAAPPFSRGRERGLGSGAVVHSGIVINLVRKLSFVVAVTAGCSSSSSPTGTSDASTPKPDAATDAPSDRSTETSNCKSFTPSSTESEIAGAIATSADGECIEFAAGTYKFDNQLALGTGNGVTISGAGIEKTIFDFSGQVAGDDAIFAQSVKNLTFKGLTVKNAPGNGIKALSVIGLTFDTLEVIWTGANSRLHGPYGLYPVQCSDVLIQNSQISGASDSGIYIGQSIDIVVRQNEAYKNVAGIEIENSYSADVYNNDSHDNTAGILVFSLPGLQQEGGHSVRVYSNMIHDNNTENFAAEGDIVHIVPAGTGSFVMACDHVEFFDNTYVNNKTGAIGIINYEDSQLPISDPKYYPYPSSVYLHDNTFTGNGKSPDAGSTFGLLLDTALDSFPGKIISDVIYDGIVDPKKGTGKNPMQICIEEPKAKEICDLNLDMLNSSDSNLPMILACTPPATSPFKCSLPALPAVKWSGLTAGTGVTPMDKGP